MPILSRAKRLPKELSPLQVYAIATGATLSSGLFLLPGLAAEQAGSAIVLAYLLALAPLVPATCSILELATAMPRAGGVYYFLDRSLGPLAGIFGGLGTWLAVTLKVAFALMGMGAYLGLFVRRVPSTKLAVGSALLLGAFSLRGSKLSGRFQVGLVAGLLSLLALFLAFGLSHLEPAHFGHFGAAGTRSILATAGLVYISYVGLTKIASLAEEVRDPERTLPRAVWAALATAALVYGLGTLVLVGLIPPRELAGDLTPVATAAGRLFGEAGPAIASLGALLAFLSVANAGILSASRYPLALSRDHLLPGFWQRLSPTGVPRRAVVLTVGAIVFLLVAFDPIAIAKLASTVQLAVFALVCLAVIVMRESGIRAYDPGFRSPAYPWMQIAGILAAALLVVEMGTGSTLFCVGLIGTSLAWYFAYARPRIVRSGAILHVFARLGEQRFDGLEPELRGILKEKGVREGDPFAEVVARAAVVDVPPAKDFLWLVERAAAELARRTGVAAETFARGFLEGTRLGATPVERGVALPHLRLAGLTEPLLVIARCRPGLRIPLGGVLESEHLSHPVHALFFLVSPEEDPGQHLRLLAEIASRVEEASFEAEWAEAEEAESLRRVLLRHDRMLVLDLDPAGPAADWIGRSLREIALPAHLLVALVRRGGASIVPDGGTRLEAGDRLTLLGEARALAELRDRLANGEHAAG